MTLGDWYRLFRDAAIKWWNDNAPRLGAALSYYTMLSLSPLLILVISLSGLVYGQAATRGELLSELKGIVSASAAELIEGLLAQASSPRDNLGAAAIGLATLLFGATGLILELQSALNTVWHVQPQTSAGVRGLIRDRLWSFGLILGLAFLLLILLVAHSVVAGFNSAVTGWLPAWVDLLQIANVALSFGGMVLLYALIFKLLPAVHLRWGDVWFGAVLTAILFAIGRIGIGAYIRIAAVNSAYGAAGSLVALLLWVYYSAQILFYGAAVTHVYTSRHGSGRGSATNSLAGPRTDANVSASGRPLNT